MVLRKAGVYRNIERAYTRKSRRKGKDFIKAIPPSKITKFMMGNTEKYNKREFPFIVKMIAGKDTQIRDLAIEASRQLILRHLEQDVKDFYFAICIYPHHILREHKMAAVAQSDRIFAGMKHAFGNPVNVAAQVPKGKDIFIIAVNNEAAIPVIRKIFDMARSKIGSRVSVIVEKVQK